jgi:hypothetical protein
MLQGALFTGAPATTEVSAEVAVVEPTELVPLTTRSKVSPMLALVTT